MEILKKNCNNTVICAVACVAGYMILMSVLVPFVYGIIDDRSMMEFVSGQYLGHPDAHTIFMGYWYSFLLTALYRAVPNVDWYALGFLVLQGTCMTLILLKVWRGTDRHRWLKTGMVCLGFLVLGMDALVRLSFTTTAAVLGVTVIFLYMTSEHFGRKELFTLFLLGLFTSQIRRDIFLMILPVCGVLWLFRTCRTEGKTLEHRMIPLAVLLIMVIGAAGDHVGYGSPEWKAYKAYDQGRTAVYDFPDYTFPTYEGAESFYESVGIEKKSRARTLINYNYTADERITPEFFGTYIAAYEKAYPSGQSKLQKLRESVRIYVSSALEGKYHRIHQAALLVYGGLLLWYVLKKKWMAALRILALAGAQGVLWIYLIYAGRLPERVIYSMNLMMAVLALLFLWEAGSEGKLRERMVRYVWIPAVCLLGIAVYQLPAARTQNLEMVQRNQNIENLKAYCMEHPENYYFNDVTSMAFTTYNVRLWQQEPYHMNYMSLGDWMSFSPIWQEKLDQNGIISVKEALYQQDNVYLICSFDKGLEYLVSLYDGVTCEEVDKIPGFRIYKLRLE